MTATPGVLDEVLAERRRQDEKWGDRTLALGYPEPIAFAILAEEVGEVAREVERNAFEVTTRGKALQRARIREELVQVAAVAVAWIEGMDHSERVVQERANAEATRR